MSAVEDPPVSRIDWPDDEPADDSVAFWAARPELAHIHAFARARRAAPWATLGAVLARVVAATPPNVVIPPLVGGDTSLNIFVALVGAPGSGKDAAHAAARDALHVDGFDTHSLGSGEGIAHAFARRTKAGVERTSHAALFVVSEIGTLAAIASRTGATLLPELRRAWIGDGLGYAYADPSRRIPIAAHTYRLTVLAGVQPAQAKVLLDDADAGTPQRFLWLPATDADAPDTTPDAPAPLAWQPPGRRAPRPDAHSGHARISVCDTAAATIDDARLQRLRGDQSDDLDGHALLGRLKVAAALAILASRHDVTADDWRLAGHVQAVSDTTRANVVRTLRAARDTANRQRAEAEADRKLVVDQRVEEHAARRVTRLLLTKLGDGDWTARGDLRRALPSRDRAHFDNAIDRLAAAGQIERRDTARGEEFRAIERTSR